MGTDGKCQPHPHTARIELDRLIHEVADTGKIRDRIELAQDLRPLQTEHRPADQHVLHSRRLEIERRTERQDWRYPTIDQEVALRWTGNAAEELEKRRFARAIASENAQAFTTANVESDVLQRPEGFVIGFISPKQRLLQPLVLVVVKLVRLGDMLGANDHFTPR